VLLDFIIKLALFEISAIFSWLLQFTVENKCSSSIKFGNKLTSRKLK